jgi:hypothetical protein
MNAQELKSGTTLNFNNEKWREENQSDDVRGGQFFWSDRINHFLIVFNGACIHASKTFASAEKRFNTLRDKWSLEFTDEEQC